MTSATFGPGDSPGSTFILTDLLQDHRLSYEAVGLYCYIASRNFQVDIRDLARGEFTAVYVADALDQLQQYGYLRVSDEAADWTAGGLT